MSDIAISAGPAATISSAPAAAAAGGDAAAAPFAALLQQQMDGALVAGLPPGLIQALAAAGNTVATDAATLDPAAQELGLESLLPALLGAKWPGSGEASLAATKADPEELAEGVTPDFLLSLPVPAAMILQTATSNLAAEATARGTPAATPAADATAILAAAADTAAADTTVSGAVADEAAAVGFRALLASEQGSGTAQQVAAAQASGVAAPPPAASQGATTAAPIPARVGAEGWDQQVGDRVLWMVGRNESRAELVLTPPQLGRIEVSLSVSGDQTNALFVSPNPAVREALESALPRLREILADAGITLGQAQVGSEAPGQSSGGGERGDNRPRGQADSTAGGSEGTAQGIRTTARAWAVGGGRGLVDVFA